MGTFGKVVYTVGVWIRETAQALDRLGCRFQGNYCFHEQLSRHRTLMNIYEKAPLVDKDAFVAPSASIIGDVQVGRGASIWYGCVLRGIMAGLVAVGSLVLVVTLPMVVSLVRKVGFGGEIGSHGVGSTEDGRLRRNGLYNGHRRFPLIKPLNYIPTAPIFLLEGP